MMGVSAQTALQVTISGDGMEAIIQSQTPVECGAMAPEEIQEVLHEAGVCTGIKDDVVRRIARDGLDSHGVVIACGVQPREGMPGRVELVFFPGDYQAKMRTVFSVRKGDVLAVLHPPTGGTPGMTVTGDSGPMSAWRTRTPDSGNEHGIRSRRHDSSRNGRWSTGTAAGRFAGSAHDG